MRGVLILSGIGTEGASNWALNPSLAIMMRLKSGRLLKFFIGKYLSRLRKLDHAIVLKVGFEP